MVVIYHQQAPLSLYFASPLAKANSANLDQELLLCFHASKVHIRSNKNSLLDQNKLIRLSNLPILPTTVELLSFYLALEQLKDRTIKSSTMSQVLCSTIILEFL
jgi:hypothetical protein